MILEFDRFVNISKEKEKIVAKATRYNMNLWKAEEYNGGNL